MTHAPLPGAGSQKQIPVRNGHKARLNSVRYSSDGLRIVTASDDKTVRVWDAVTGQCLATLAGQGSNTKSAQFSPDGACIATPAGLWDAATGKCLAKLGGGTSALKPADWLAMRERLRAVGRASAGQDTPYLRMLRRYVTE
ncbi:MAG: WD40 repeat domain-containing protein [Verrucomicrobiales bacterium]